MHRLSPLDGLRGYLALWVVVGHVMQETTFGRAGGLINQPVLAVDCFMAISGFVIFMLLDQKREHYGTFIFRRFFRIYPVYLILFLLSIPCIAISRADLLLPHQLASPAVIAQTLHVYDSLWDHRWIHIPLHLALLQGLVPSRFLPHSSTAFLAPAWSLSLEWQFYLVAPFAFALLFSKAAWHRVTLGIVCAAFILESRHLLPSVDQGAALVFQLPFFLLGMASYLLYRETEKLTFAADYVFPFVLMISLGIYEVAGKPPEIVPFLLWALVLALIMEPAHSYSSRLLTPLFTHRAILWAGQVSYSIYLSHILVLVIAHYFLLKYFFALTQVEFFAVLLFSTLAITLLVSALLYGTIEAPFIALGRRLARSWRPSQKRVET
jgi:peptidoglycan/LPS O-acetylase OafA/YrhL